MRILSLSLLIFSIVHTSVTMDQPTEPTDQDIKALMKKPREEIVSTKEPFPLYCEVGGEIVVTPKVVRVVGFGDSAKKTIVTTLPQPSIEELPAFLVKDLIILKAFPKKPIIYTILPEDCINLRSTPKQVPLSQSRVPRDKQRCRDIRSNSRYSPADPNALLENQKHENYEKVIGFNTKRYVDGG